MINSLVQDARDEETLHLGRFDIKLVGNEGDRDAGVRTNQFDQDLSANVSQKIWKKLHPNKSKQSNITNYP